MQKKSRHQSGNAIIMVLIGVILFGALMYTFMRGSQQGQGNMSAQQAKIQAAELISFANKLEQTTNKLLSRGCSQGQLSFEAAANLITANPSAPSDKSCHLFDAAGGGLTLPAPPSGATYLVNGRTDVTVFGCADLTPGAHCSELIFFVQNISQQTCLAINTALGVSTDETKIRDNYDTTPFSGTMTSNNSRIGDAPSSAAIELQYKSMACLKLYSGAQNYNFYKILIVQ